MNITLNINLTIVLVSTIIMVVKLSYKGFLNFETQKMFQLQNWIFHTGAL